MILLVLYLYTYFIYLYLFAFCFFSAYRLYNMYVKLGGCTVFVMVQPPVFLTVCKNDIE